MAKAYGKYILALLLFGSNGIVASRISLNSYEIVLLRTCIGSLLLIAIFLGTRQKDAFLQSRRHSLYLAISGAAMGASWMFLYEAYSRIGVSIATLAYYCGPVIVMALSPLLFRERLRPAKVLGFIAVAAGMLFVNQRELSQGGLSWGLICGISSALMYAVMVIFNKKAASITGLKNSMCQLTVSFLVVALFTLLKQGPSLRIPAASIGPVLLLGLMNTGLGCYLYFSALPHLPAQSVAVWGYLEPLSALLFSALLLDERLAPLQGLGTALILGGAAFAELYGRKKSAAA